MMLLNKSMLAMFISNREQSAGVVEVVLHDLSRETARGFCLSYNLYDEFAAEAQHTILSHSRFSPAKSSGM